MLRHGCFIGLAACAAAARDDLVVLAAWADLAAAGCVTAGDALVDALAMVRPRPRLAPRTPAAMAVPASGREILIWSPLAVLVASGARRLRTGPRGWPAGSSSAAETLLPLAVSYHAALNRRPTAQLAQGSRPRSAPSGIVTCPPAVMQTIAMAVTPP